MLVLTCLLTRRRIGAYLDGALENGAAQSTAKHLSSCTTCQHEAEQLRRMRALLQRTLGLGSRPAEPEWSGFWPGVVRGIEDARSRPTPAAAAPRRWRRPRWALGGALVTAMLVSVTIWQTSPGTPDDPISVNSAQTEDPRGTVMVYSTQEKDVAVVWVLGLDDAD
jgi:anti-sigma factor RsiW